MFDVRKAATKHPAVAVELGRDWFPKAPRAKTQPTVSVGGNTMSDKRPLDVVALIRVSTDAQAAEDRAGIPAQKTACKQIAEKNGLTTKWVVQIEGVSGAAVMFSPGMKRLQQIVRSGQCHGIVMKEHTRLLRPDNFADYALLELLKDHHVRLYTTDGVLDLSTNTGQFFATVQFGMAGYERRVIRERTTAAKEELRRAGKCAGPDHTLPFGVRYDRQHDKYRWVDHEIDRVVRLFELFTEGKTKFSALARETAIPYGSIRYILTNPIYTGWRVYELQRDPSTKRIDTEGKYTDARKVKREEPIRVRIFEKGVVSEDLFARAQQLLILKRQMNWRRNNDGLDRFPYRGLIQCAECGSPLLSISHNNGRTHHDYYVCRCAHGSRGRWDVEQGKFQWRVKNNSCPCLRMQRGRVDAILDNLISTRLSDPDFLFHLMRDHELALRSGDNLVRIDRLTKEIADAEERKRRLKVLYVKGDLDEREYETVKASIGAQIAAAQKLLTEIKPDVPHVSRKALAELVSPFCEWQTLSQQDRRSLLVSVAPVFRVGGYGNGRTGRAAQTQVVVKGFYLNIAGLPEATVSKGTAVVVSDIDRLSSAGNITSTPSR
jgi:DNA invertase Pin-like site-specific DNA recombinase